MTVQTTSARNPLAARGSDGRFTSTDPDSDFKATIAGINKYFADRPQERDRRIIDALVAWAGPAPEPDAPVARVEYDPVTNTKYVDMSSVQSPTAEYEKTMQYWKMGQTGALTPHSLEESERRDGLSKLTKIGGKIPPRVAKANEMVSAISVIRNDVPPLDVNSLDPKNIEAEVTAYVDSKMRADAARVEYQRISGELTGQFVDACRESVSDVLSDPKVRGMFDTAAKAFTENYPVVSDCHTLVDAAGKDTTGQAVAAWHRVQAAVRDLNTVVDVIVHFAAPKRTATIDYPPNRRIKPSAFLGISAEPTDGRDALRAYLGELTANGIDATDIKLDGNHVFGVYGAQVDAGCTLSLPQDAAELNHRRDSFNPRQVQEDAALDSAGGWAFGI